MSDTRTEAGGIRLFNEGERLQYGDLNDAMELSNRSLLHIFSELLRDSIVGAPSTGFFGGSCAVSFASGLDLLIAAGVGLFYDSAETSEWESHYKVIALEAAEAVTLEARDADPRIDLVCLAPASEDDQATTDLIKDPGTGVVSTQAIDTRRRWYRARSVVKGTAAAVPSAPAIPTGYVCLAEVYVPTAGDPTVTDTRPRLRLGQDVLRGLPDGWISNFIPGDGDELLVQADGSGMSPTVEAGDAVVDGAQYWYRAQSVTCDAAPGAPNNRYDLVVATKTGVITVRKGTPAVTPTVPVALAGQVALAKIYLGTGVTVINSGDVTDLRDRSMIPNASIDADAIAPGSVTTPKLLDEAVTGEKLDLDCLGRSSTTNQGDSPAPEDFGGGTVWVERVTNGTTVVELDSSIDWRDRHIFVKGYLTTSANSVPGGSADDAIAFTYSQTSTIGAVDHMAYSQSGQTGSSSGPGIVIIPDLGGWSGETLRLFARNTDGVLCMRKSAHSADPNVYLVAEVRWSPVQKHH